MILDNLKPNKISDIVFRVDEYLNEMEKMDADETMEFINFLENYIFLTYFFIKCYWILKMGINN